MTQYPSITFRLTPDDLRRLTQLAKDQSTPDRELSPAQLAKTFVLQRLHAPAPTDASTLDAVLNDAP